MDVYDIMSLKITTWNLKHAYKLVSNNPSNTVLDRRRRVYSTIKEINPDFLCIQEGPKGEQAIDDFCTLVLNREWVPVLLKESQDALGDKDKEYGILGNQWIWFLVQPEKLNSCRLQSPKVWQSFVGKKSGPLTIGAKFQ